MIEEEEDLDQAEPDNRRPSNRCTLRKPNDRCDLRSRREGRTRIIFRSQKASEFRWYVRGLGKLPSTVHAGPNSKVVDVTARGHTIGVRLIRGGPGHVSTNARKDEIEEAVEDTNDEIIEDEIAEVIEEDTKEEEALD